MKWLYAAYKKGGMELPEGLGPREFEAAFYTKTRPFNAAWLLISGKPVGVALAKKENVSQELHAVFFPWASTRQIMETSYKYLDTIGRKTLSMTYGVKDKDDDSYRYLEKLRRLGVLRGVGTIRKLYSGRDGMLYQTVVRD